jgi:hypothetical protein
VLKTLKEKEKRGKNRRHYFVGCEMSTHQAQLSKIDGPKFLATRNIRLIGIISNA